MVVATDARIGLVHTVTLQGVGWNWSAPDAGQPRALEAALEDAWFRSGTSWGRTRWISPLPGRWDLRRRGQLAERLVDAEIDAVFVVSADCRLVMANAAGADLIAKGSPLVLRNGRLYPASGEVADYRRAVERACSGEGGGHALPLQPGSVPDRVLVEGLQGGEDGLACLRLRDFGARLARNLQIARGAYGLTPAESALAESLMRGLSPAEHALQRGIRMPTVRSQLASIYAKAGVAGHAELVMALWLCA